VKAQAAIAHLDVALLPLTTWFKLLPSPLGTSSVTFSGTGSAMKTS
jgi:hypothetical protein